MNLDLIGDDVAVSVAHWIDFGDREAPVAQLGQSFLERVVKIVLESRRLFGRRENPRINAIRLLGIFFGAGSDFNDAFDNVIMDAQKWGLESVDPLPNSSLNNLTNLPNRNIGSGLSPALVSPARVSK